MIGEEQSVDLVPRSTANGGVALTATPARGSLAIARISSAMRAAATHTVSQISCGNEQTRCSRTARIPPPGRSAKSAASVDNTKITSGFCRTTYSG